jgi:hypothetical protein
VFLALQNSIPLRALFSADHPRCEIARPVEGFLAQRALSVYSAREIGFAAPDYLYVRDALKILLASFARAGKKN